MMIMKEYKMLLVKFQLNGILLLKLKRKAIQKIIFSSRKQEKELMAQFAKLK